jgi:hypothetical protein
MKGFLKQLLKIPKQITPIFLDAVILPNGEIISMGKSLGYFREFDEKIYFQR